MHYRLRTLLIVKRRQVADLRSAPKFRFGLRTLLVALAIGPIVLALAGRAILLQRRASDYQIRAASHEIAAEKIIKRSPEDAPGKWRNMEDYTHHRKLAQQYRNAAKTPWVVVREAAP
jgi:hypothetical protein